MVWIVGYNLMSQLFLFCSHLVDTVVHVMAPYLPI